jgi:hypothetical protein
LRTVHRTFTQAQGASVEQDAADAVADDDVARRDQSAGHVQRAGGGRRDAEVDLVGTVSAPPLTVMSAVPPPPKLVCWPTGCFSVKVIAPSFNISVQSLPHVRDVDAGERDIAAVDGDDGTRVKPDGVAAIVSEGEADATTVRR